MPNLTVFFFFLFQFLLLFLVDADFHSEFDMVWGGDRTKVTENGGLLQLSLDKSSGSGFQSKNEYLFGKIDMQIKLVPGDSAGTVTAYYLTSPWPNQDEIDFEFLGNSSGEPYILHTNVYTQGKGDREQQFYLWFDPRQNFHTYSILWNHQQILFSVDGTPIRVFRNAEGLGVPYPKNKAMRLHSTLWCADDWATRGGLVKTDWTHAPFTASYRGFKADTSKGTWWNQALDANDEKKLKWVQSNYMIYNYCTDHKRFPQGFPPECSLTP